MAQVFYNQLLNAVQIVYSEIRNDNNTLWRLRVKHLQLTYLRPLLYKKYLILLLPYFLFVSCETKTEWPIQYENNNTLIVDGLITNEVKAHEIRLSRTVASLNAQEAMVSGAQVTIFNGIATETLQEDVNQPGVYVTNPLFSAAIDRHYTLSIAIDDAVYVAEANVIRATPFKDLTYEYVESQQMFRIDWISDAFAGETAMYVIDLDWSAVPGFDILDESETKARVISYTFNSVDVSQVFAPNKEALFFPEGTIITERKYSLTPEYAQFLRALVSETEWRGGYFDVASSNVPTNVSGDARGFFAASTVISSTIVSKGRF